MRTQKEHNATPPDCVEWREKGRAAIVKHLAREGPIPTSDVAASLQRGDARGLALYLRNTQAPDPDVLQALADLLDPQMAGDRKLVFRRQGRRCLKPNVVSPPAMQEATGLEAARNENGAHQAQVAAAPTSRSLKKTDRPIWEALERLNQIRTTIAAIAATDPEMADALRTLLRGLEASVCGDS